MHVILSRRGCSSVLGIQCPDDSISDPHLMVNIWKDHLGTAIKPRNLFLYLHPDLLSAKVPHFCNSRFLKSCKNAKYTPSKPHSRNIWHHRRVAISILACSRLALRIISRRLSSASFWWDLHITSAQAQVRYTTLKISNS